MILTKLTKEKLKRLKLLKKKRSKKIKAEAEAVIRIYNRVWDQN